MKYNRRLSEIIVETVEAIPETMTVARRGAVEAILRDAEMDRDLDEKGSDPEKPASE